MRLASFGASREFVEVNEKICQLLPLAYRIIQGYDAHCLRENAHSMRWGSAIGSAPHSALPHSQRTKISVKSPLVPPPFVDKQLTLLRRAGEPAQQARVFAEVGP
jgi:hypothetical protein